MNRRGGNTARAGENRRITAVYRRRPPLKRRRRSVNLSSPMAFNLRLLLFALALLLVAASPGSSRSVFTPDLDFLPWLWLLSPEARGLHDPFGFTWRDMLALRMTCKSIRAITGGSDWEFLGTLVTKMGWIPPDLADRWWSHVGANVFARSKMLSFIELLHAEFILMVELAH